MYTLIINLGEVVRNSDGVVVAPCDDISHQDYQDFLSWQQAGGILNEVSSPGEDYELVNGSFQIKLSVLKTQKLQEIKDKLLNEYQNGSFLCSLGFRVDNRRYEDKNDKDNVQSLIDLGIPYFKDSDNVMHTLTMDNMTQIKKEMSEDGLSKYQKKWALQDAVNNATTIEELQAIVISF